MTDAPKEHREPQVRDNNKENLQTYICTKCGFKTDRKSSFTRHLNTKHSILGTGSDPPKEINQNKHDALTKLREDASKEHREPQVRDANIAL